MELFSWNPRRAPVRRLPLGPRRPTDNFGDVLGPVVVRQLLRRQGTSPDAAARSARLLSIGSVLHLATDGDVVWGTGLNGKIAAERHTYRWLDVRAVRGPLTRDLLQRRGIAAPPVYGDPGLLVGHLWTREELRGDEPDHDVTVVPNLNDLPTYAGTRGLLRPTSPLRACLRRIAASRLVVGSALHGVVVAESLGIPARLVVSQVEHPAKYEDYYLGTGREARPARDVAQALSWGGQEPPRWEPGPLLAACPRDLWTTGARTPGPP